jgi:hypothetical protein
VSDDEADEPAQDSAPGASGATPVNDGGESAAAVALPASAEINAQTCNTDEAKAVRASDVKEFKNTTANQRERTRKAVADASTIIVIDDDETDTAQQAVKDEATGESGGAGGGGRRSVRRKNPPTTYQAGEGAGQKKLEPKALPRRQAAVKKNELAASMQAGGGCSNGKAVVKSKGNQKKQVTLCSFSPSARCLSCSSLITD